MSLGRTLKSILPPSIAVIKLCHPQPLLSYLIRRKDQSAFARDTKTLNRSLMTELFRNDYELDITLSAVLEDRN